MADTAQSPGTSASIRSRTRAFRRMSAMQGVGIEETLHALQVHTRRHRPLRRTCECRVIDCDAIKESRRPGSWRGLAAWSQLDVIADQRRFQLRTPVEVQPIAKRLRQNEPPVFSRSDRN